MDDRYSEAELIKFLDWLGGKGLINSATAKSRKIAAAKVLSALDEDEKRDLRTLDKELVFQRFSNKGGKEFTPDSLTTYKSRFNSALEDFFNWRMNPAGFKPGGAQRAGRGKGKGGEPLPKKRGIKILPTIPQEPPHLPEAMVNATGQQLVFPIPIRNGVIVKIHNLPLDLSQMEAERICSVIKALAVHDAAGEKR